MNSKRGFSLIELLVVIAIIGVLLLISFPLINHLVEKNNESKYDAYREMIREASKIYIDELGFLVSGCYEIKDGDKTGFEVLEEAGLITNIEEDCKGTRVYIVSNSEGKVTDYKVNLVCNGKNIGDLEYTENKCEYEVVQYKNAFNSNVDPNVNSPELNDKMVPVKYYKKDNTAYWIVADEKNFKTSSVFDEDYAWYLYNQGYLANAVFVNEDAYPKYVRNDKFQVGTKIDEDDVTSWWVWIPRFEYKKKDVHYILNTSKTNTEGYTIHSAFTTTKQSGSKELTGFWMNKNISLKSAVDDNGSIVGDDMHSIQEYLDYGIDFSKENQSHVIRDLEFSAAYLINSANETKINDMDQIQFTGGNYGGSHSFAFNNVKATINYTNPTNSAYINAIDCTATTIVPPYKYECKTKGYKICNYDTKVKFPTGFLAASIRECNNSLDGHGCIMTKQMYLSISPNGYTSFSAAEKNSAWYKYLDIYEGYGNSQMSVTDLCSSNAFNTQSDSTSSYIPWTFRKENSYSNVGGIGYEVTYDLSSIFNQLSSEFKSSGVGHTTNMTGKTYDFHVSAIPKTSSLNSKFSYGTRLAMYY